MLDETQTLRTPETLVDDEVSQLINDMQHDWCKLNEFLNNTAQLATWCGDYEDRLRYYNDEFRVLKLEGRSIRGYEPDPWLIKYVARLRPSTEYRCVSCGYWQRPDMHGQSEIKPANPLPVHPWPRLINRQ